MVKHIVLYTFKEGVDKKDAVALIASKLEPLVGVIPGLRYMEVRQAYQGYDYVLYSEFDSAKALQEYAEHPAHLAAKDCFWDLLDTRCSADYEL